MKTAHQKMILSVLVTSHQQKEQLRRCLESILLQNISYPWEVIISDDRSTDGTYELAKEYATLFNERNEIKNGLLYRPVIHAHQCNSDECDPENNSDRCGWNKLNAYEKATGKYFITVDADDYLIGSSVYNEQIEVLESHPEISMCAHRLSVQESNSPNDSIRLAKYPLYHQGAILSVKDILLDSELTLNQVYMIRRDPFLQARKEFGKLFNDQTITLRYLRYGNCYVISTAGYVWATNPSSITRCESQLFNILKYGLLGLVEIQDDSYFAGILMQAYRNHYVHTLKYINTQFDKVPYVRRRGFMFDYFHKRYKIKLIALLRIWFIRLLLLLLNKYNVCQSPWTSRFLYGLMTDFRQAFHIPYENWLIDRK